MAEIHTGVVVKSKAGPLNKALKIDFKSLFKSLSKGVLHVGFQNWPGAAQEALNAVSAVGKQKDPGKQAWLLVHAALTQSVWELVGGNFGLLSKRRDDFEGFCDSIGSSLDDAFVVVDDKFFERPGEAAFLKDFSRAFERWLAEWGLEDAPAQAAAARLPSYFTFALNDLWRQSPEDYSAIQEALDTPFTRASRRELSWIRYAAWLNRKEPVFEEPFSLQQIYIPLRAYFEEKRKGRNGSRRTADLASEERQSEGRFQVVDLAEHLDAWLKKAPRADAIRVISGGPGSGKTSFAKLFAARHAAEGKIRVLFIPLHLLELHDSLVASVKEFVRYDKFLSHNPLDPEDGEERPPVGA